MVFHVILLFQKQFCISVAKPDEKYNLPAGYSLLSEIPEASAAILDSRLLAMLNKYPNIESIHISDVFTGPQDTEQQQLKQPETKKMLIVSFFIPEKSDMEEMHQLLQLVIYLIEKLKRYRLSREVSDHSLSYNIPIYLSSYSYFRAKIRLIRIANVLKKNS